MSPLLTQLLCAIPQSILLSVISMLSNPNDESPANIEAAVRDLSLLTHIYIPANTTWPCLQKEWRENRDAFKKRIQRIVRKSQEDM